MGATLFILYVISLEITQDSLYMYLKLATLDSTTTREISAKIISVFLSGRDFNVFEDIVDDVSARRGATEIAGVHSLINGLVNCVLDNGGMMFVTQMTEHIDRGIQHCNRIRDILAGDAGTGVTSAWLEDSVMIAVVLAGQ